METHGDGLESAVTVEIRRLSVFTHHGTTETEREVGQRLEFDVSFDVPDCDAVLTDRIDDTVDYGEVCDVIASAATDRRYNTLERVCRVVGERMIERFGCEAVQVRAFKPEPPLPVTVRELAVEVTLDRGEDEAEEGEETDGDVEP